MHDVLAVAVFMATIAGVIARPRGWSEAVFCVAGAATLLLLGVVTPRAAWRAVADQWDVLLFLAGLLTVSWAAERADVFRWAALQAAHGSRGSGTRLFFNSCAVGIVLTTFFSLDATALLLTAVLAPLTLDLELPPAPYVLACAFLANSASLTLPVSNPLNILVLGHGGVRLGAYLAHVLLASVIVISLTVLYLWLRFRSAIDRRFDTARLPAPRETIRNRPFFAMTAVALILLAAAYVLTAALGWPLSLPVAVAGLALLVIALTLGGAPPRTLRGAAWTIVPFVAGLLIVVQGLETTGLTARLGQQLLDLARRGTGWGVIGAGGVAAAGSNAINNLPMGAVMLSALRAAGARSHPSLLYGTLLGADVGPNFTVLGALSTMLWLLQLRRSGVAVGARDFLREGLLLTPLLLIAGGIAIALLA
jgi:arsenical pump membrane protein